MRTKDKIAHLMSALSEMKRVIVAFSGGVDSSVLLRIAADTLGENVVAVTAVSEIHAPEEIKEAKAMAAAWDVRQIILETDEMHDPDFIRNPEDRCYYCKLRLFSKIRDLAREQNIPHVLDGSNKDDLLEIRPGMKALKELGIRSPLREAGLTKKEIRGIARRLGLANWNKPALACLASRIPFGSVISRESLKRVHAAEQILRRQGFSQIRVRDHYPVARIEVPPEEFNRLIRKSVRERVSAAFKDLGYRYVTVDMDGYRSGSLHKGRG